MCFITIYYLFYVGVVIRYISNQIFYFSIPKFFYLPEKMFLPYVEVEVDLACIEVRLVVTPDRLCDAGKTILLLVYLHLCHM